MSKVTDITAVERPILVCGVNILKASKPTLVAIVRELNRQIEQDKDMAKLSTAFVKDAELIQESIDLVIKQIDEGNPPEGKPSPKKLF